MKELRIAEFFLYNIYVFDAYQQRVIDMRPIKEKTDADYAEDVLNKLDSVASVNECTGLMPVPPENEEEAESYTDIYVVPKGIK